MLARPSASSGKSSRSTKSPATCQALATIHSRPTSRSDGRFGAPEELRRRYEQSQAGVADDHTIVMCGSGVTACHLLLAMEVAGKPGARLYAGSWSEWITDAAPRRYNY